MNNDLLWSLLGVAVGTAWGMVLTKFAPRLLKKIREKPELEWERISSLSLRWMTEGMGSKIKIVIDSKKANDVFSFKFKIRNTTEDAIEEIPIVVGFEDKDVEILKVKEAFESGGEGRKIRAPARKTRKNKRRVTIPSLARGETVTFDVFTKGNKTAELKSLGVDLIKIKGGLHVDLAEKREISPVWHIVLWTLLTAVVVMVVVGGIAVSVQKLTGGGLGGTLLGMFLVVCGIFAVIVVFLRWLR